MFFVLLIFTLKFGRIITGPRC